MLSGNWHWGYLYKKYPGSYYYPHWQQTHYAPKHYPEHHVPVYQYPEHHIVSEKHVPEQHIISEKYIVPKDKIVGQQYVPEHQVYGEEYKKPYVYQQKIVQPEGGIKYQTIYKQGIYSGSGHYAGASEYHSTYPIGIYPAWKGHDEYLHQYYENKYIGDIVGGTISLDNKPLGYPFDRPIATSAFYVKNIYVKDVVVYHQDEYFVEY